MNKYVYMCVAGKCASTGRHERAYSAKNLDVTFIVRGDDKI